MNKRTCIAGFLSLTFAFTFPLQPASGDTIRGIDIPFVTVGNPGNGADVTSNDTIGAGGVPYNYDIGTFEITAQEWTAFLNIVDPNGTNAYGLWGTNMRNNTHGMQINNSGTQSGQHYVVTSGSSKPVVYVNWQMAARFCNYLTSGNTEQGPYVVATGTGVWGVDRATAITTYGTIYTLPTLSEWYKAAYHDGLGLTGTNYWDYPIQANAITNSDANYGNLLTTTTDVGSYPDVGAYGTHDQGGNVREWIETPYDATRYWVRGGSYDKTTDAELKANGMAYGVPTTTGPNLGFRITRPGGVVATGGTYNVMTYGATGNGATLDTLAIQSAIDTAYGAGGGTAYFPSGTYKTITVYPRSNVTLNISPGAKVLASPLSSDWPSYNTTPLVMGLSADNVTVNGGGEINCSGGAFYVTGGTLGSGNCPKYAMKFDTCNNLVIQDVTIRDSVQSDLFLSKCNFVTIDDIQIYNPDYATRRWTDGIDIERCSYVTVQNSSIETGDDGIAIDSSTVGLPTHDILVQNCTIATTTHSTKFGSATYDEIYNVTFDGITVLKHSGVTGTANNPGDNGASIDGIQVSSCYGSAIHDVTFSNYVMEEVGTPIFIVLQNLSGTSRPIGSISNITMKNIFAKKSYRANQINVPQVNTLGTIIFNNVLSTNTEAYSGTTSPGYPSTSSVAEPKSASPGHMPAQGLFARNVTNLRFEGRYVTFYDAGSGGRPSTKYENTTFTNAISGTGNYVDDNFDGQITNTEPQNWELTEGTNTICSIAEVPSSTNKSMQIYDNDPTVAASAKRYYPSQTGTATAEVDFAVTSTSQWNNIKMKYEDCFGNTVAVWLELSGGSLIAKNGDGSQTVIQAVSPSTWYTVKIVANVTAGTFDVYVNGVMKMTAHPFKGVTTKLNCLECGSGQTGVGTMWIDNVKVY